MRTELYVVCERQKVAKACIDLFPGLPAIGAFHKPFRRLGSPVRLNSNAVRVKPLARVTSPVNRGQTDALINGAGVNCGWRFRVNGDSNYLL